MQTIELEVLSSVVGGCGQAAAQPEQAAPAADAGAAAAPSGGSNPFDMFLQVLQSPAFAQILGGFKDLFTQFTGGAQQASPTQQAAPAADAAAG